MVKTVLVHYQFETTHPFLDGNGRIRRLLITLSLINDGVLSGAIFYPSMCELM
ncbi:Fic family protein [Senegalimassilia faecalis]|uniref:Fic family protein n=1 Tax=Senegalimassilia faecalis TaxID=2509433 RepID=UPI0038B43CB8